MVTDAVVVVYLDCVAGDFLRFFFIVFLAFIDFFS